MSNLNASPNWQCDLVSDRLDQYLHKNPNRLDQSTLHKIHNLQTKLKHNIFEIAALGLASCGKTTILNRLQGKKNWLTSPLHGTTTGLNTGLEAIAIEPNSPKIQIRLIDTPGLDELGGEARAEIAIEAAHQADLILFITAGDLTRQEIEIISQLKQAYKPLLLVFNKIDLYPQSDRQLIYEALQELQALISPNEIIFTSAAPLARRVRLQCIEKFDDKSIEKSEEVWEKPPTDIKDLKQKILDLLNQDGKSLLAINTMRSLLEIHRNYIQTQLDRFLSPRTLASGVFGFKAIAILISPSPVLDFILSTLIDSSLILGASRFWGYERLGLGLGLGVISGIILITIPNHYGQIIWLAGATPWLIDWLKQDLHKAPGLQNLVAELTANCTPDSILHRLNFKF